MRVTHITQVNDDARPRRRAPVLWPWVLVIAAWTIAGLAVLTNMPAGSSAAHMRSQERF